MAVTAILLSIFLTLVATAFYYIRRNLNYWQQRGIPCDPPHWMVGNLKGVPKTLSIAEAFGQVYNHQKGSGPFCGLYFLHKPSVLVLTSEFLKQVLIKDFNNFADRGMFGNEKIDPLTGHLFALDGQKWRVMRNKLSPTFTSGQMRFMFPTMVAVGEQFTETVIGELKKSDIFEIKDILARYGTDIIGSCAFGIECNSLKNPDTIFREMGRRVFTDSRHSNFVNGVIRVAPRLAHLLRVRMVTDDVTNFFLKIVREAVDYRKKNDVQRKDFLNLLMELNKVNLKFDGNTEGRGLTVEEMAAQAFGFFIGGFETASTTLSFMLYELSQNKAIQQRMREEIVETLAKYDNVVTYEYINSLPYMKQVISETLRKYPVLPYLKRKTLDDYVVHDHPNYVIEKGTNVFIPVMAIHHDPEIYPEPEKFNPDRFSPEELQLRDSIYWLPFGEGPRNCIGMRFGQMQMRIALINLLRNFEINTCELTEIPLELDRKQVMTSSKNGIHLKLRRI